MDPEELALYLMVVLGACAMATSLVVLLRRRREEPRLRDPLWRPLLPAVFGFGMLGVGAFGPAFLTDYGDWLKNLASLRPGEEAEGYKKAIDDIAGGAVPREYRQLATAYMLQNPVENLDRMLDDGARKARGDSKALLQNTRVELTRKKDVARLATAASTGAGTTTAPVSKFDTTSLRLLKPNVRELRIDPKALDRVLREREAIPR